MARKLIRDWPIGADILDGKYDADLHVIESAITARRKELDRAVGATVGSRFTITQRGNSFGKVGTIVKVNPKRYIVHFDGDGTYREFSCPKTMGTVETGNLGERIEHLKACGRDQRGDFDFTIPTVNA